MLDYQTHIFANGLRLIYKQNLGTRIAHCGFTVDAGSRDEREDELGLAHLIEHMLFKGTPKKRSTQILNRLEVFGGELNAFTSKDKTCIYALIVDEHFGRAVELLTDITFNSTFPEKELAKEKKVIADEIDMYLDTPEERIFDEFQELFYRNHPLGTNILGTKESLAEFKSDNLTDFRDKNYTTNNTVFSFVGRLPFEKVVKICAKYLDKIEANKTNHARLPFSAFEKFKLTKKMPFVQAHVLVGCKAYEFTHPNRPAMMLLTNMLGGPGLNSIFNLSLREKYGFTYGVETTYQSFADTGMFNIYWSTDIQNLKKSIKVVLSDLIKIREKTLSVAQLNRYKTQFKGQLIMAEESKSGMMLMIARSILDLGKVDSLEEVLATIEAITPQDIQQIAKALFEPDNLSWLIYEPKEE
jgi:predicted Zn-dependent peptidase